MRFQALATDYDGTIAHDGRVDEETAAALASVRHAGDTLIMVTGRELTNLLNTFERLDLFDRVVAENGAVLYEPATRQIDVIAPAPPEPFVERLTRARIPFSIGRSVVASVEPHAETMMQAIRELGIAWHIIYNKGSVMALPADVTKATGLSATLDVIGIPSADTIGVGDAENDRAFLRLCGLAVAVGNALPSVKETADLVMDRPHGHGVVDLIDRWHRGMLPPRTLKPG